MILIFFISLISNYIFADVGHYKNILVGDKAATMGGTYVAVSEDASGMYYNPAGIAHTQGTGISASANVYHIQHSKYVKAIRTFDWERQSAELLPNFFGIMKNWGNHVVGFSIVVPDSFVQHQDQIWTDLAATSSQPAIDRYVFNLHAEDISYLIGPSYAYKFSDKFSAGITLSYFLRKSRMQNSQTIWMPGNLYESAMTIMDWSEKGFAPKLGIRWSPLEQLNLGLTLSHVFITSSQFNSQLTTKDRTVNTIAFQEVTSKEKRNTTTQISFGTAYRPTDSWLLVLDLDFNVTPNADVFFPDGYQGVINYSIGAEYSFNKRHAARIGFFTNQSNMQEPSATTNLITHLNMYGVSTGYTLSLEATTITLGLVYSNGRGESQIYSGLSSSINVFRYTLTGLLSTSFKF